MNINKGIPNIFFTADWHIGDKGRVSRMRKFGSVENMNEIIVQNHNEVVKKGDLVHHLGDMYMRIKVAEAKAIQARLNGNFYVIEGNHDKVTSRMAKENCFVWMRQLENITIGNPWLEEKKLIVLCHYAMRTWKSSCHGTWQLYGHSHGGLPEIPHYLSFDVGVDVPEWNYYPVSIEQVIQKMNKKIPLYNEWRSKLTPSSGMGSMDRIDTPESHG